MAKKKKTTTAAEDTDKKLSFEAALAKLENIVVALEENELGLEQSLGEYESGVRYLNHCYQLLERAQRRIAVLRGVDEDGNPLSESFDEEEMSLETKAQSRARRRTHGTARPSGDDGRPPLRDRLGREENNVDDANKLF